MAHGAINAVFPVDSIVVSLLYSLLISFPRNSPPLTEIMPQKIGKAWIFADSKEIDITTEFPASRTSMLIFRVQIFEPWKWDENLNLMHPLFS